MNEIPTSNKRIAKNTILLYIRTIVVILVTLYTSRVVLQVLGVEDFGIYNVVAGIVVMFSFVNSTLSSASQRYVAYELPRNNLNRLRETFSLIMLCYSVVAIVTFLLSEIIGVWFLNTHMNIPESRMHAANWVLQASIISFLVSILNAPYMALVIAHEHMDMYAYFSIADSLLKLMSIFILQFMSFDYLILYAIFMLICTLIISLTSCFYCRLHFEECHYTFFFDRNRWFAIISFAWWNMFGAIASLLRGHGVNILLNIFFNPTINAARTIAYQVNAAIMKLSSSFFSAIEPQITKSYSVGNYKRMHNLILSSSRLSFCLVLILSLPIYLHTEQVLKLWLVNYPGYTVVFVRLLLINCLLEVFSAPLVAGLQATGKIKLFQIIVSGLYLLNLPLSYFLLKCNFGPESTIYINMFLVVISMIPRIFLCDKYYNLKPCKYVIDVLFRCFGVAFVCYLGCKVITESFFIGDDLGSLCLSMFISIVFIIIIALSCGITKVERHIALNMFRRKLLLSDKNRN